jgi:hypothetical protein
MPSAFLRHAVDTALDRSRPLAVRIESAREGWCDLTEHSRDMLLHAIVDANAELRRVDEAIQADVERLERIVEALEAFAAGDEPVTRSPSPGPLYDAGLAAATELIRQLLRELLEGRPDADAALGVARG